MIEKSWHLSARQPLIFPVDESQRDWIDRFEHWPQRVIQKQADESKSRDVRTACMASANAITLHLSRKGDHEGVQLDPHDQMIKVNRPVSCLAFGSSRRNQTLTPVLASGHANGNYLFDKTKSFFVDSKKNLLFNHVHSK